VDWCRDDGKDANHRRVIAGTLRAIDRALCEFGVWARGSEQHSVLYHEANRLTDTHRRAIEAETVAVRRLLKQIRDRLDLQCEPEDVASGIWGQCFALKESLSHMESRQLVAYGKPSAELAGYIDPLIAQLESHVDSIIRVVGTARGGHSVSPKQRRSD